MFSYFVMTVFLHVGPFTPSDLCGALLVRVPPKAELHGNLLKVQTRDCSVLHGKWRAQWLDADILAKDYTFLPDGITKEIK